MNTNFENAHILVVDDQQANIDVIHDFLEIQGYQNICTTTDPRKVSALMISFKPDIVLLDLAMPHLTGFEILEQIRKDESDDSHMPVLVLTADATIETKRKALQSGASDFLTKPFDLIELQARVNTHLLIKFKNNQVKDYAEKLEKLVATKDKFFSIIAHDLRNPFVGIENYIQIILKLEKFDREDIKEQFGIIRSTALQGHELLENLLRWARSQTDTIELNMDVFLLKEAVNHCFDIISTQAENKGVKLVNSIDDTLFLDSDQDVVETILRNLISNAVKYTNSGGYVEIGACSHDSLICISVIDTGVGIESDDIDKLFKINKNLQSRKGTSGEKGSGLGLILCKEFADKLGGTIEVQSAPGKGTTFTVKIPNNFEV